MSLHLPANQVIKAIKETDVPAKSCLKQKQYDLNIKASQQKIELNFFSITNAPKRQKMRESHVKSILNTYNTKPELQKQEKVAELITEDQAAKDSTVGGSPEHQKADRDMDNDGSGGEDNAGFVKATTFRAKPPTPKADYFEGIEGFKVASNNKKMKVNLPSRSEDFSFLKKNKVKFNCVDIAIKEYQLDPDELEEQKKYSSKYL